MRGYLDFGVGKPVEGVVTFGWHDFVLNCGGNVDKHFVFICVKCVDDVMHIKKGRKEK